MTEIDELHARIDVLEARVNEETSFWRDTLQRVQKRKSFSLKGARTKIAGWLATLPMISVAGGFQVDPAATAQVLQDQGFLIAALQLGAGAAVHYYRNQAKGPVKP